NSLHSCKFASGWGGAERTGTQLEEAFAGASLRGGRFAANRLFEFGRFAHGSRRCAEARDRHSPVARSDAMASCGATGIRKFAACLVWERTGHLLIDCADSGN